MNHWDLIPGETVNIVRADDMRHLRAIFRFRDTLHICFEIAGESEIFRLKEDGGFSSRDRELFGFWRIAGKRANSRSVASAAKPQHKPRPPGANNPAWRALAGGA